jgi:ATP-dependent Clp protease ATP-binding subunit ClpA
LLALLNEHISATSQDFLDAQTKLCDLGKLMGDGPVAFGRFTNQARLVMKQSNREACAHSAERIDTPHVLLALVDPDVGLSVETWSRFGIDADFVRGEVKKLLPHRLDWVHEVRMPQTRQAKCIIECAIDEAHQLSHPVVDAQHFVLGLLNLQDDPAAQILRRHPVSVDQSRAAVVISRSELGLK